MTLLLVWLIHNLLFIFCPLFGLLTELMMPFFRSTAILYMRRAKLDWELICKITGHKNTQNLIRHYDVMLESQGKSDLI